MSCKYAKIIIFLELLDINIQNINQHLMFCHGYIAVKSAK